MSMKPLVKTFHSYLNEELSPEEQRELDSMGFSQKTQLDGMDEVVDALNDHFWGDEETKRLYLELKARLVALCDEFRNQYRYSESDMYSATEQIVEYSRDDSDSLSTVVADTISEEF